MANSMGDNSDKCLLIEYWLKVTAISVLMKYLLG